MFQFLQNEFMVTLTILGLIIPALISIFSVLNHDSFDRKLMPRHKSAITFIKQIVGIFLITIPTFVLASYFIAYFIAKFTFFYFILIGISYIIIVLYFTSLFLSSTEWCVTKITYRPIQQLLEWTKLYRINKKYKIHIHFSFLFTFLFFVASIHLQNKTVPILTKAFLFEFITYSIFMGFMTIILLLPIFEANNKKEYKLLIKIKNEEDLLTILQDKPLILEYFLNESVAIYSAGNYRYRIIKRRNSDSEISYEIYEVITETS